MAPYPGLARFKQGYTEVSSWQGKEMRTMMKFLLAITGPLLTEPIKTVKCEEEKALECVWSLCELHVTDVTGRTDRGTRQTCKRGQEQDEDGARLDWDWTRRYFVSQNTRQDRNRCKGRNV